MKMKHLFDMLRPRFTAAFPKAIHPRFAQAGIVLPGSAGFPLAGLRRSQAQRVNARIFFGILLLLASLTAHATVHDINLTGSAFEPDQLSIEVGDTVVWHNISGLEHTSTSDDLVWDSDVLEPGDSFSFTFTDKGEHLNDDGQGGTYGEFDFYCQFHGQAGLHGMSGAIFVHDAGTINESPATPTNVLPVDNAASQPVAVQLRGSVFSDPENDFHAASEWIVYNAADNSVVVDSGEVIGASLTNYVPPGLAEGTTYDWQVRYKDGRGAWSDYSAKTRFTTLVSVSNNGIGLKASYNNIVDFTSPLVVETNATVNFDWEKSRPNRRITADNFAVRWEGSILPQFTELYAVQFQYRGRARVWVNDQLLIDEWAGCVFTQSRRAYISLVAGQLTSIRVEYVADPSGAAAVLRWTSPSLPIEIIPTSRLFPTAP